MFEQKPNLFYHYCEAIILQKLQFKKKGCLEQTKIILKHGEKMLVTICITNMPL